ncbi:MAG: hypothetical protein H0A76_07640 [Candidatus Thiodubiliella endoseptemdiera]|uniref:Uncharacterized protein n=1 Tax=Candidatus Thiodubiliella endoseptemdiera TaxID=2738886 RepID=A0A853F6C9_9GAMM|nr:hypothetical protein [Candidatus Thiodubiliella endoseptemdiera]
MSAFSGRWTFAKDEGRRVSDLFLFGQICIKELNYGVLSHIAFLMGQETSRITTQYYFFCKRFT